MPGRPSIMKHLREGSAGKLCPEGIHLKKAVAGQQEFWEQTMRIGLFRLGENRKSQAPNAFRGSPDR